MAGFTARHPLTVLIVDDHFVVRSGRAASLELDDTISVVAEADRGEDAVAVCVAHRPRAVMDLPLPGLGGGGATAALRACDPQARVSIFSSYVRDDEMQAALDAGALGYLQNSASRDELLTALHPVAPGRRHLAPELERRLGALRRGPAVTLRKREILALVAAGRANKEIAGALGISEGTVKRHVSHIVEKLNVHDRAQVTAEAIRRGIIRMPE